MHGNINTQERKQKIDEKMSKIKHKIAVMSGKGGVGKAAYTNNTAINFAGVDKVVNCNIYLPFFSKKSACLLKIDLLTSTQVFS